MYKKERERYIEYLCEYNDMVAQVDLAKSISRKYTKVGNDISVEEEAYGEYRDQKIKEVIHPEDYAAIIAKYPIETVEDLLKQGTETISFECRLRDESGEYCWYSYRLKGIPKDKKHPKSVMLFKKNIDAQKKQQEQEQRLLEEACQTAQRATHEKDEFLTRMSHEIRTPLNAVIGYMTMAKKSGDNVMKMHHCIENSELAALHLMDVVNDILDISAISGGKMKLLKNDFDFRQQLADIAETFYTQAKQRGIDFKVNVTEVSQEWLLGDSVRINQVLSNFLSNAVKFTPEGGKVRLTVKQEKQSDKGISLGFSIEDNGIGIPPEQLKRIVESAYCKESETIQRFGDTGFGLSIARGLIDMMGGSLEIESQVDQGTVITVTIPVESPQKPKNTAGFQHEFSKVRVLYVNDGEENCDSIKHMLKASGVKGDVVSTEEEALQQLMRRQGSDYGYHMCIVDFNMHHTKGQQLIEKIQQQCEEHAPVIVAAVYDTREYVQDLKASGVEKIVAKPVFVSTIQEVARDVLAHQSAEEPVMERDFSGMHILLVEDEDMNREIAREILKEEGILVDIAVNGKDAVDLFLDSEPGTYQGILMDVQMPVLDGYGATKEIRQSQHVDAKEIPIIAITANAFSEDVEKALECGMNGHIAKPVNFKKLFQIIDKYVKNTEDK